LEDLEKQSTRKKLDAFAIWSLVIGLVLGVAGVVFNQLLVLLPAVYLLCVGIGIVLYDLVKR